MSNGNQRRQTDAKYAGLGDLGAKDELLKRDEDLIWRVGVKAVVEQSEVSGQFENLSTQTHTQFSEIDPHPARFSWI